jgi:hemerythrin
MPIITLGVPLMDRDHAHLETLLLQAGHADDAALPELLMEIEAQTRAHFGREEELMRSAGIPILPCHIAQHAQFLSEFERRCDAAGQNGTRGLRHLLCTELPTLFRDHVGTVDWVTAGFFQGLANS